MAAKLLANRAKMLLKREYPAVIAPQHLIYPVPEKRPPVQILRPNLAQSAIILSFYHRYLHFVTPSNTPLLRVWFIVYWLQKYPIFPFTATTPTL